MTYYLDASAAVKLVKPEWETPALVDFLSGAAQRQGDLSLVSADLLQTELISAVTRAGLPVSEAIRVLSGLYLLRLSPQICETAGFLAGESGVRSLDALHLATALSQRSRLTALITYDQRLAEAARHLGLAVDSPG
jgi:uncharacterized protein